jgi:hypothetical protein
MKKLFLVVTSILMLTVLAVACEEDEPSEEEARAALCADLEQLETAVDTLLQLDAQSTVGEVEAARDNVRDAVEDVESSAEDVSDAQVADLQQAFDDLDATVEDTQDDQTVEQVLDAVRTSAENVAAAEQQLFAELSCGGPATTEPTTVPVTEPATEEPTIAETVPAETSAPTEPAGATETAAPTETVPAIEATATSQGG